MSQTVVTKKVALAVLWYNDAHLVLVKKPEDTFWEIPCTRIAEGETLHEAVSRCVTLAVGLNIGSERFGEPIRRELTEQGALLISTRANLSQQEFDSIRDKNPAGNRHIIIVSKNQVEQYLKRRRDRKMLHAGMEKSF